MKTIYLGIVLRSTDIKHQKSYLSLSITQESWLLIRDGMEYRNTRNIYHHVMKKKQKVKKCNVYENYKLLNTTQQPNIP